MEARAQKLSTIDQGARLWIFALEQTASAEQLPVLAAGLEKFVAGWKSHGTPVDGAFGIFYGRFIVIAADERNGVSGCSIDGLVREVRAAAASAGAQLADISAVQYRGGQYRDGVDIKQATREEFAELVRCGAVTASTIVFDLTVSSLAGYHAGAWELPFARSWHARAF